MPESSCVQDAAVPSADEGSGFSYAQGPVWLATKEPTHARMEEYLSLAPDAPGSIATVLRRDSRRAPGKCPRSIIMLYLITTTSSKKHEHFTFIM